MPPQPPPLPSPPPPPPPPPLPPPTPLSACRFPLPPGRPAPTSLLLAPPPSPSRALALLFPDSSACLIPSLPASGSAAASAAATAVPSPLAAAACFALLLPSSHLLFLSAHPSPSSPALHLRAYSLASGRFAPAPLSFKRHVSTSGLPLHSLQFGLGVRLAGGVNAVALLSMPAGQIWVLAPTMAADGRTVVLHKCAVVELDPTRPAYAMEVAMGRLLLGEVGGVRVFSLRGLIKGGKEREGRKERAGAAGRRSLYKKNGILNGLVVPVGHGSSGGGGERDAVSICKLTTLRIQQTSGSSSFFLAFNYEDCNSQGGVETIKSVKAVSIHPLSKDNFLVLDSAGVLHVFSLPNKEMTKEAASKQYCENTYMYRLDYATKVQLFAVFPSSSTKTQIFWVSDGGHSIHIMSAFDVESPKSDNGDDERERGSTTIYLSAIEAIFTSEKVQDIVPINKDSVLILGQGNMFLYGAA